MKKHPIAASLMLALTMPAAAYQPLVTDDTGTQGLGGNQIELATTRQRQTTPGTVEQTLTRTMPVVFTRGFAETLDLYLGATSQRIATTDEVADTTREKGWGNVAIGAKWRFFEDEKSGFSLGVKPEVQLPVSDDKEARGLGNGKASWSALLIASRITNFGELHFNLTASQPGYALASSRNANRPRQWRTSIAPVWKVGENLKLALDLGIMTNPDRTQRTRKGYALLGAVYSPSEDIDLALGFSRENHDGAVRTLQGQAGLTWRFK